MSPGRARIVETGYYGVLSLEKIAQVIGRSASTVKRDWCVSRAWLLETVEELKAENY